MRRVIFYPSIGLCSFMGACSIAPDISDVSPLDTAAVVRHIECETQIAFLQTMAKYLADNLYDKRMKAQVREALAEPDLAARLSRLSNIKVEKLTQLMTADPKTYKYLAAWGGVVIGYGYTFDITENNNNSGGLNFLFPVGVGSLKVDTTAGAQKTRQNTKTFTIVTTIPLIMQSGACLGATHLKERQKQNKNLFGVEGIERHAETAANVERTQHSNLIYPITGKVGMEDVISSFAAVWWPSSSGRTASLVPGKKNSSTSPGNVSLDGKVDTGYVQTLAFQTKLTGKIAPTIEVSGSNLTKGTLTTDHHRLDKHKVIITFVPPMPKEIPNLENLTEAQRTEIAKAIRRFIYQRSFPPEIVKTSIEKVQKKTEKVRSLLRSERQIQALELLGRLDLAN